MTHAIVTTMQPGKVVEVSDSEFVDLTRMGVVASEVPATLADVPAPLPSVAAMQAGGPTADPKEVGNGQEQEAIGGGPAQATGQ